MQCPNCGQELSDQDTICPNCGRPLPTSPTEQNTASTAEETEEKAEEKKEETAEEKAEKEKEEAAEEIVPETGEHAAAQTEESSEPISGPISESLPAEPDETPVSEETPAEDGGTEKPKKSGKTEGNSPKPAGKKLSKLSVLLIVIIAVLVVAVVCLVIALTTASDGESVREKEVDADAVAVTLTDPDGNTLMEITNAELCYYYWGEYYYYVQSYGYYFDYTQPLDEQSYSDDMTWQDYFLACACSSIQQIYALLDEAESLGFEMPDEYQEEYDDTIDSMESYAVTAGFLDEDGNGDVLAYVQDSYGSAATVESFADYLYTSYYVTAYSDEIYLGPVYTDEEIENYYDENSEMFTTYGVEKSDLPNVDVRHILIMPEDAEVDEDADEDEAQEAEDAVWAEALAKAEEILAEWQDGDATEDSFAELAETYSEDSGSNADGGLYENVYPGEMVDSFNDWCFDESRQPGDTDIVETSYGYHIMYFIGFTDSYYWKDVAESELRYDQYSEVLSALVENYIVSVTDDLGILEPDAVSAMADYAVG